MYNRRAFLQTTGVAVMSLISGEDAMNAETTQGKIQTVLGTISAEKFGRVLPHEHVMVDFIGADKVSANRYNAEEVFQTLLPYLKAAKAEGIESFVECTPNFLGRDVRLLERLAKATGLNILTNTGLYQGKYLPDFAHTEDADTLAARWIKEAKEGIDGTKIRPGFIKIAVNPGNLLPIQKKIVQAAARTSKKTGLTIACHTGHGVAALETLDVLRTEGLPLSKYIFVHADSEPDLKYHFEVARAGGWVEYDAIGWKPISEHVKLITRFLAEGLEDRLLLSHDAGWYHVGEPNGGTIQPFTPLTQKLLPLLEKEGLKPETRDKLLVTNPRKAFTIGTK